MHYDVKNLTHQIWSNGIKNYKENLDYLRGLFIIKNLLDTKDHYTYIHSVHVSRYAYLIGRELKLSEKELQELYLTALLHDIGKSEIPTDILLKNDHLTQQEYIEVKKHVFFGAEIVKDYKIYENLSQNILYHHERWDGEGYPLGLKGKEIPLISRIVNLADSFDAMTTVRPYKA
ncbi:MAG: HD-GYP domain-containing protein, partial [Peptococcales bacterium]